MINNIPCVGYADLAGIVSYDQMQKWVQRGVITRVRRQSPASPAMFALPTFPEKYRIEVYKRHPDLNKSAEGRRTAAAIEKDMSAIDFFEMHEVEPGRHLDFEKQDEYANNAAILNRFRVMLEEALATRAKNSQAKKLNKTKFWAQRAADLAAIADKWPNSLPENPRRLQEKFADYQKRGYIALVSGKFLNSNASDVTEQQKSLLITLMGDGRNLDNETVRGIYNAAAQVAGWPEISVKVVETVRKKNFIDIDATRLGETTMRNKYAMQVTRTAPTAPLLYWTLDGWTVELYYKKTTKNDKKGHYVTTYTNRLTMVVVLDPCCKYPVGYAIGDHETPELIGEALRNATNHTAELFGQRYRTNQIQSDNYGRGAMKPIYEVMGEKYTPARAHNAKAKVIEPYFNYLNRRYCHLAINWAGYGITSNKEQQPNSEHLNKHRHAFPDEVGCRAQIAQIIEKERETKREAYVKAFANLPEERKLPLSDEQYLLNFGAETGHKNVLEGQGLLLTIEGEKRHYECFDTRFRNHAHVRWTVKYDPDNLDRALAINGDGSLRFMLEAKHKQPMALADRSEGDAKERARIEQFNDKFFVGIAARRGEHKKHVEELIAACPQIDISLRSMLTDSDGQHKIYKPTQTKRIERGSIRGAAVDVAFEEFPDAPASGRVIERAAIDIPVGEEDHREFY
ncbi:MAG: hypothetical protein LBH06_00830 [Rikenellaceae bacterium]|nr:hypothetical protein [Rikenellaceae bacterium]